MLSLFNVIWGTTPWVPPSTTWTMALVPPPQHGKAWQVVACIWQHLATSGNTGYSMSLYYWGGSRRVLRGVLRFQTKPGTWPADIAYELWNAWNAWNAWKLSRGAVLELWQTEITTYFGEKTKKPKSFLCTCLRTIVRSHFHGISWHGDEVSTEALNPLPRSLVTGSHWGITGIDAGCLRLGLSDQCPGRTDRPMSRQCCDTVERNKIPLIDLYLCKPCRLARVIENKAYPKRGFEWFLTFSGLPEQCVNDHWMIIEWFQCLCAPCAWASEHIRTSYSSHQQVQVAGELL